MSEARTELLAEVLDALRAAVPGLSPAELIDALWLAPHLPTGSHAPLRTALLAARGGLWWTDQGAVPEGPNGEPGTGDSPDTSVADPGLALHAHPTTVSPGHDGASSQALRALRVPAPRALRDELLLARALRPLRRLRPGRATDRLDETATASAVAETGLPDVVMRSRAEPQWRCLLLVDDGLSMRPWESAVRSFDQVFRRSGSFAAVELLGLNTRAPGRVRLHRRVFTAARPLNAVAPCPPRPDTLLLVVSDGVGPAWRDGRMQDQLAEWSARFPTAVVHMLPRRLWSATGADAVMRALSTRAVGGPWTAADTESGPPPVPLVELTPAGLADLSAVLGNTGVYRQQSLRVEVTARDIASGPADPAQRLAAFQDASTPQAYRLAAHVAATAPVTFPVLRLLAEALAPEGHADPTVVAEVLLGGLLQPVETSPPAEPLAREFAFDLDPAVKDLLLDEVPTAELVNVAHRVAAGMQRALGRSPGFTAWHLTVPADESSPRTPRSLIGRPFAQLARGIEDGESTPTVLTAAAGGGKAGWDEGLPRPLFFLSYAHSPRGSGRPRSVSNLWEARLFRDLCEAVTDLSGWDADEPPGFMDSGLNVGEGWSDRISEALAHSKVFVPLYSPRYFTSQACGQEWAAFASREVLSVRPGEGVPSAIVPVQWVRVQEERLPSVAKTLQFDHQSFGEGYRTEGMQSLVKINAFRSDYQLAIHRLAQRIVEVSERMRVRIGARRDFQDFDSAFPAPGRRRSLRILVMACDLDHLPDGRSGATYGTRAHEWRPFAEESEGSIAHQAAVIAREWEFHASIEPLAEEAARIFAGEPPQAPALLLLDRWSLLDRDRRELLRRFDAQNPTWVGLMEPWDPQDPENASHQEELRALSERTLVNLRAQPLRRTRLHDVDVVSSLTEFESMLPHVALGAMHAFDEAQPLSRPTLRDSEEARDSGAEYDVPAGEDG